MDNCHIHCTVQEANYIFVLLSNKADDLMPRLTVQSQDTVVTLKPEKPLNLFYCCMYIVIFSADLAVLIFFKKTFAV